MMLLIRNKAPILLFWELRFWKYYVIRNKVPALSWTDPPVSWAHSFLTGFNLVLEYKLIWYGDKYWCCC
jgi:hypothetical protein